MQFEFTRNIFYSRWTEIPGGAAPRTDTSPLECPRGSMRGMGGMTDIVQMSGRGLVCAIAPRPTKSGIARPHQNPGGGPGNFARIAPKKRPIIAKFCTLVEFIEAHILVI
jgi:hypothetical protein